MTDKYIKTHELSHTVSQLSCGDKVYLTGTVYTARDAAHLRLCRLLADNIPLPFDVDGAVIYFAGPTPTKSDGTFGSFGPTTSSRMDPFSPVLLDNGLAAMIGKGNRNNDVIDAIKRNSAVYFCAGGGFGALISECITDIEEIAFPELGCESIKKLTVNNMPLIVAIDCKGNTIFERDKR